MSHRNPNLLRRLSADTLVEKICSETPFISELVDGVASRKDCTIYHLLLLAATPVVTAFLGGPEDEGADMWQNGGVIETKFRLLSLKEQIAAAHWIQKEYTSDQTDHALGWIFSWIEVREGTQCYHLLLLVEDDGGLNVECKGAFLAAFELLADKEGLLK